jgi:hypothetical protein
MITRKALSGYLLEELLAKLVQSAGYRLLTDASQDPTDLANGHGGDLLVRGRGALHQVDVLGEFNVVPPFSQPLRLFIEAKARVGPMGLPIVRNAVGTISDVNEGWMIGHSLHRSRRRYLYALFATSGFSLPAQDYALAHQVSLIDLSGPEWKQLRDLAVDGASELLAWWEPRVSPFPVKRIRNALRLSLRTFDYVPPAGDGSDQRLRSITDEIARRHSESTGDALLAFPANQHVLLARPDDLSAFLRFASEVPVHEVSLAVSRGRDRPMSTTWVVRPVNSGRAGYSLSVTLPKYVEEQALAESDRRAQSLSAKNELGGQLDIFWDPRGENERLLPGPRLFRLTFAGMDLRQRRVVSL